MMMKIMIPFRVSKIATAESVPFAVISTRRWSPRINSGFDIGIEHLAVPRLWSNTNFLYWSLNLPGINTFSARRTWDGENVQVSFFLSSFFLSDAVELHRVRLKMNFFEPLSGALCERLQRSIEREKREQIKRNNTTWLGGEERYRRSQGSSHRTVIPIPHRELGV